MTPDYVINTLTKLYPDMWKAPPIEVRHGLYVCVAGVLRDDRKVKVNMTSFGEYCVRIVGEAPSYGVNLDELLAHVVGDVPCGSG